MTLAYFNSMAGMVPVKIAAVGDWCDGGSQARVKVTAARGPYERGDMVTTTLRNIVPRNAVYRRAGTYRIMAYKWSDAERGQ